MLIEARAKGDEANTVYILDSGKLPYTAKNNNDAQKEQETNLVYVAITRAKKTLYFVDGEPDIEEHSLSQKSKVKSQKFNLLPFERGLRID